MSFEFFEEEAKPQDDVPPTLAALMKRVMKNSAQEMRVSMPAKVIKYNRAKNMVDVKPFFKRKYADGTVADSPVIYNVPVHFPRAGKSFISMPIKKDHVVTLLFADRSMSKWLSNGEEAEPDDTRTHHMSDAYAIPGGYPFSDPAKINNSNDVIIKNENDGSNYTEIRVKENGHIQFLNKTDELVKVLNDMLTALRQAKVYTSTGPQKLRHSKFTSVQNRLKTFLQK